MRFQVAIIGTSQSGKSSAGEFLNGLCGGGYFDTVDMLKEGLALELLKGGEVTISMVEGTKRRWCTGPHSTMVPGTQPDANMLLADGSFVPAMELAMAEVMRYKTDRPEYRQRLLDYGIEQEKGDPLFTVSEPLRRASFVAGTRTTAQIVEMKNRVDWVLWIHRPGYPPNSTDQLGPEHADFVIDNSGQTLMGMYEQLRAFLLLFGPGTLNLERRRQFRRIDVDSEDIRPAED